MNAFSTQAAVTVSTLHTTFGEAAIYTAPSAAPVSCTVILTYHDEATGLPGFATEVRAPGWEAHLKQAEIPSLPPRGATITIVDGGRVLTVQDAHEDAERSEFVCDVA